MSFISIELSKILLKLIPHDFTLKRRILPILPFYHIVSDDNPKHTSQLYGCRNITAFVNDIDFLLKHYKPVSLEDLNSWLRHEKELPDRCFHLTFDDGFRECHDIIAPILIAKGVPATFFVCSDFMDNKQLSFRNKISLLLDEYRSGLEPNKVAQLSKMFMDLGTEYVSLCANLRSINYKTASIVDMVAEVLGYDFKAYLEKNRPYLSNTEIDNLIHNGFTIGSHSIDHPHYKELSLQEQVRQTVDSMFEIKKLFSIKTRSFAFPHSDTNVSHSFFDKTHDMVDIYFGTNRMKKDAVPNCLQRFSLEDNRFTCEEIIKRNLLLQTYYELTLRGTIKRPH